MLIFIFLIYRTTFSLFEMSFLLFAFFTKVVTESLNMVRMEFCSSYIFNDFLLF